MGRISERKIEWESICRDLDMEKRDAKKIVSYIKETMKKIGIENLSFGDVSKIINAYNYVNLTNLINDIDEVDLLINKHNFALEDGMVLKMVSRKEKEKYVVSVCCGNNTVITEFGDYDLSPVYQMAYDIYSGLDKKMNERNERILIENCVKDAIDLINGAKHGDIYRRDIFISETLGICFAPIDIINIGAISDSKRTNIPYVIGILAQRKKNVTFLSPHVMEISLVNGGKQYLNEASLTADDEISLRGCESLAISMIQSNEKEGFKGVIENSIMHIIRILIDRLYRDPSFDADLFYDSFMNNAEFVDDDQWKLHQENAPEVRTDWFEKKN